MHTLLRFTAALCILGAATVSGTDTFDYLMLSQEWPYTFCTVMDCQNTDKLLPLFNIHGLWPEHVAGSCQGKFNYSELKPLEAQLKLGWMDLKNPVGDAKAFWTHEYQKHGRCAAVDGRYATTFLYFKAALQLHGGYNLTQMLASSGIVPGPEPVKVSSIRNAIIDHFGYEPVLACSTKDQTTYLAELRICFEKDMSPRNCSSGRRSHSNSHHNQQQSLLFASTSINDAADDESSPRGERVVPQQLVKPADVIAWSQLEQQRPPHVGDEECDSEAAVLLPDKLGY